MNNTITTEERARMNFERTGNKKFFIRNGLDINNNDSHKLAKGLVMMIAKEILSFIETAEFQNRYGK